MTNADVLFWSFAGVLCAVGLAFLLVPAWVHKRRSGRWSYVCVACGVAIGPIAVVLYLSVTTWDPAAAGQAAQGVRLVAQLAERLRENPDDIRGWRLLGSSYMVLGQYVQARAAFAEAWERTPLPDDSLKVEYAEAQIFAEQNALTGPARRLFEQVLETDPTNPKALWYGGLAAAQLGYREVARMRWTQMLEHPFLTNEIRRTVQNELASLGPPNDADDIPATNATIEVVVSLGDEFRSDALGSNAVLFILARPPGERTPVAAGRWPVSALPGAFRLSDANSMAGRSLADHQSLAVVARISMTGDAIEHSGDWVGEGVIQQFSGVATVELVIDRVVP